MTGVYPRATNLDIAKLINAISNKATEQRNTQQNQKERISETHQNTTGQEYGRDDTKTKQT